MLQVSSILLSVLALQSKMFFLKEKLQWKQVKSNTAEQVWFIQKVITKYTLPCEVS